MFFNNKQVKIKYALQHYVFNHDMYKHWMNRYENPLGFTKSDYLGLAIEAAKHANKARKELEELLGCELDF